MARISTYINDTTLNDEDLLTGSNFIRIGEYNTRNYKLVDLAEYFANFQISDNQLYNFATISQQVTTNVSDIAANATYSLNLGASFGVVDDDGNLTSLSEAFANNLLSVATSEDYATATQLNSLTATVDNNTASISTNATDITSVTASTTQNTTDITTNTGNISTVTTTASANATAISTLQSDLSTANTSISQNATDITTLDSSVTTINTTITGIEGDITSNTTNITANASNITTLTNNLATTDANVTQNASDVTSLSTTVSTNTTNISNNGTNITSNTTNITTNASDISTLTNNLATANTNITQNASDVTSLTSTVSTNTTDIATAEGNITANTTNISTNASDITTLTNNLATTDANVTQNATDVTSLTTDVTTNTTNISTNGTNITTANTNIATNATAITTLTNNLTTTDANVTQNASDVTTLTTNVTTNTTDIATNGTNITTANTNIATNATNITTLTNNLATAEADIVQNASDVTSLTSTVATNTTGLGTAQTDITTNATNISTLNTGLTTANTNIAANSTDITTLDTAVTNNGTNITANATNITSLSTTVGNNTTSITTNATSINGIEGKYGVTIDSNGALTGFDLIGGGGASIFKINADDFKIYNSGGDLNPFSVSGSKVQINGDLNVTGTAEIKGSVSSGDFIAAKFKNTDTTNNAGAGISLNSSSDYHHRILMTGGNTASLPDQGTVFDLNASYQLGQDGLYSKQIMKLNGAGIIIPNQTANGITASANYSGGMNIIFNDNNGGRTGSSGRLHVNEYYKTFFLDVPGVQGSAGTWQDKVFVMRAHNGTGDQTVFDVDTSRKITTVGALEVGGNFNGQNGYFAQDVGIGFTSGSIGGKLDIVSSSVGINIKNNYGTAGSGTIGLLGYTTSGMLTSGAYHLVFQADNGLGSVANMLLCDLNGNLRNFNNSYGQLSDINLKENITPATNKLEEVKQLEVKNFNFIGNDLKQIGLIAQDVEQIFPGLVENIETPQGDTVKSVKYSVLVPILIKAIQELEARVATLEG
jgi:predicted  nucleic acid-binding Zn-ribbon protein